MGKIRLDWVDIAKGIAILAVVILHTDYHFPNTAFMPIKALIGGNWHVAVFFMIGGFFINEEKLSKPKPFIMDKFKSLYLLAAYFYVPAVLLHNVLFSWEWYDTSIVYGGKIVTEYTPLQLVKSLIATLLCAGREPILGAVWFVYSLFLALCMMSLLSWGVNRVTSNTSNSKIYAISLLIICIFSCTLTRYVGINIPRFNNTLTAMWLIYVGFWLRNKTKVDFSNKWGFIISLLVFLHFCMTPPQGVTMNANKYTDVITLTVGTVSALYVICYLSIKLQGSVVGSALRKCGQESFYIMALQFVGFKIGVYILSYLGYNLPLAQLLAPTENKLHLMVYFVVTGALFPIAFMWTFRKVKVTALQMLNRIV